MLLADIYQSKKYAEIPTEGYLYAVLDKAILFKKYNRTENKISFAPSKDNSANQERFEDFANRPVNELHFFDSQKEFRLLASGYSQSATIIEYVASSEEEKGMEPDLLYEDEMMLEEKFAFEDLKKIKVVNRYKYTFFDTLALDNYRLKI
jgi:hypothetical protein